MKQPRGDYREFLELACIFLGGVPPRGIIFKVPGANHHVRWLAKAIYSLKIYMFKGQFNIKSAEIDGLREICIFVVLFYVKAWFTAPIAIAAPHNDLSLLQNLIAYSKVNSKVVKAALTKVTSHLWYLCEDLVGLGCFDPSVSTAVKIKMRDAMQLREGSGLNLRRIVVKEKDYKVIVNNDLSDVVTKRSRFLFEQFGISTDFLQQDPRNWESNDHFQRGFEIFKNLKVINDVAERGIALIQEFNNSFTRDEEQKQYALKLIQNHRKKYPNPNKKNFM